MNTTLESKKVYLKVYGCQMNAYDAELVQSILTQHQFTLTETAQKADIVLLNTCSVRENAHRKVYGAIHQIHHERNGKPLILGILGCMATALQDKLIENKKLNIDFIAGPDSYQRLPEIIQRVASKKEKISDIDLSSLETYENIYPQRKAGANAWISIMRGCNNFCSFCIVPYARGRERSRPLGSILFEAEKLAARGYPQVTLLGQNVNSYAHDGKNFTDLIAAISKLKDIKRIRFISPHPKDFSDHLLEEVAGNPKICKHIHLPLQSGSDRVLKLMNRRYTQKRYLMLVEKIKKKMRDVSITTDIIVGFPTETKTDYQDTKKVVKRVQFDSAFIFKYSPREGTLAALKHKDDVGAQDKTKRTVELNEIQKKISLKKNRRLIGKTEKVLIEEKSTAKSKNDFQGRTDANKLVVFPKGSYKVRDFIDIQITDATAHILKGHAIA